MKKALKIIGITVVSLLGLVLVVAGVAAAVISSSGQLTQIVKKYAPEFITCEMQMDRAELTLFKTFPNVGIDIGHVALINPMEGSPSDTLANIDNLIVVVDAKKLKQEKEIVVRKCILQDAFVNLYTDSLGNNNFNVFKTKDDDTIGTFDYWVEVEEVKLKNATLLYADDRNGMKTCGKGLNLDLKGEMKDKSIDADLALEANDLSLMTKTIQLALKDLNFAFAGNVADLNQINGTLKLTSPDASLSMGKPCFVNDTLNLDLPLQLTLSGKRLHLDSSRIRMNRYLVNLSGDVEMAENKDINLDVDLNTSALIVEDVLKYLPEKWLKSLGRIECAGRLSITEATVKGTYSDSLLPRISAKVVAEKARVNVPKLPYPFTEVNMNADVYLDLNSDSNSVTIHGLKTKFNRSSMMVDGLVDDLMGDIGLKLKVKGDVLMTDLKGFLPQGMKLDGRTKLDLTTGFTVKQLLKTLDDYNLNRLSAKADLKVGNFGFDMDTIHAAAPSLDVRLVLPASAQRYGKEGAFVALNSDWLNVGIGNSLNADLKNPDIEFTADDFKDGAEEMLLDAGVRFSGLELAYDTVNILMDASNVTLMTVPEKNAGLKARVAMNGSNMVANLGKTYAMNTTLLKVNATMNQDKDKAGFLGRWNPEANVELGNAVVKVDRLGEDIHVSNMDFLLNSNELDFKKGTFQVGHSDFCLQGSVIGIKDWKENHKNLMKGNLEVVSNVLNINEILDYISGFGISEESGSKNEKDADDDPFMVPMGIDFTFALNTKKALYDNFDLNNLGGAMTVKDGTLILQEIGFTNKAAEMQLTAIYQSPRKNNLFLAMDFHLLNVQINDLLQMIPYIDTLVPMLKTFDGQAEFHIGAETSLKANYEPKISTLRGAADIEGKNLTVNDTSSFTKIADKLDISTNGEYRVDSLDVQLTAFRDEIDLLPSQIAIGKYKVIVDGRMTLDKNGDYHLSVTESPLPTRFGLNISGSLNNLEYKFEKTKYPTLYKPKKRSNTEQMYIELKERIASQLKEGVKATSVE